MIDIVNWYLPQDPEFRPPIPTQMEVNFQKEPTCIVFYILVIE